MINYDTTRGGVTVSTEPGPKTHSRLIINSATTGDSGNYTCRASNTEADTIYVFVSKGKQLHELFDAARSGELRLVSASWIQSRRIDDRQESHFTNDRTLNSLSTGTASLELELEPVLAMLQAITLRQYNGRNLPRQDAAGFRSTSSSSPPSSAQSDNSRHVSVSCNFFKR